MNSIDKFNINGIQTSMQANAKNVIYENNVSQLLSNDIQGAIDELSITNSDVSSRIDSIEDDIFRLHYSGSDGKKTYNVNLKRGMIVKAKLTNLSSTNSGYFALKITNSAGYTCASCDFGWPTDANSINEENISISEDGTILSIENINNLNFSLDLICQYNDWISDLANNNSTQINQISKNEIDSIDISPSTTDTSIDVSLAADTKYNFHFTAKSTAYFSFKIYTEKENGKLLYSCNSGNLLANPEANEIVCLKQDAKCLLFSQITQTYYNIKINHGSDIDDIKETVSSLNGENPNVLTVKDCVISKNNNIDSITKTNTDITITKEANKYIQLFLSNKNYTLNAGDFIFLRMFVTSTQNEWIQIVTYSVETDQIVDDFYLEQNVEREICFMGTASKSGSLHFGIQISNNYNLSTSTISFKNIVCCVNNFKAYTNFENMLSLKDYSPNNHTFIVDRSGDGHFYSIANAVNYVRRNFDVQNKSYIIYVRNGLYNYEHSDKIAFSYPAAVINKGSNRISIIGESRENTIIEWTSNSICQAKIIEVGSSPCCIKNLTIKQLCDYSSDEDLGNNPYCLHIDLGTLRTDSKYITEIANCNLYSECHSPIGAGVSNYQTIYVHNCKIVANSKLGPIDALYIHAYAGGISDYDSNMTVDIENNILINLDKGKALTLPDVSKSTYKTIPITTIGNLLYTNGTNITDIDFNNKNLTEFCFGNNVASLNKTNTL